MKDADYTDFRDRIVLLVDDDAGLMHMYHNWMASLSYAYAVAHYNGSHRLYDRRVFDIDDLNPTLDSIKNTYRGNLDLAIVDFDIGTANGNDAARMIRAKFPNAGIIGNTGGDPARFDRTLVDKAVAKIADRNRFYAAIRDNTTIVRDSGRLNLFNDAAGYADGRRR